MDKKKEIKNYLRDKLKPELPFNDLYPCSRYEEHDRKCKELAEAIVDFIEKDEPLK